MRNSNQFEGWYFKHQASGKSLAIILGRSIDSAFILVVTDTNSYHIPYPLNDYHKNENHQVFHLRIGDSIFTHIGIVLNINHPDLTLIGEIAYTNLTPIDGDIMGPFRFFPMECRHGVVSMNHNLKGTVILNGEQVFTNGKGYIESDSGRYIYETLAIPARFRFMEGNCCLFDGTSDYASYEYMMQE